MCQRGLFTPLEVFCRGEEGFLVHSGQQGVLWGKQRGFLWSLGQSVPDTRSCNRSRAAFVTAGGCPLFLGHTSRENPWACWGGEQQGAEALLGPALAPGNRPRCCLGLWICPRALSLGRWHPGELGGGCVGLIAWRYRIGSTPVLQYFGAFCSICKNFPLGSVPSETQYIFFNSCFRSFLQLTVAVPAPCSGAQLRASGL